MNYPDHYVIEVAERSADNPLLMRLDQEQLTFLAYAALRAAFKNPHEDDEIPQIDFEMAGDDRLIFALVRQREPKATDC